MAPEALHADLVVQLSAIGTVRRSLVRALPRNCQPGALAVLEVLHHHGDLRLSRLAELLSTNLSVTSRQVAHLAGQGWVNRLPDPADGRSRILRLSDEGRQALAHARDRTAQVLAARLADWPDEDVTRLAELLGRLRTSFDQPGPAPAALSRNRSDGETR